MIIPTI